MQNPQLPILGGEEGGGRGYSWEFVVGIGNSWPCSPNPDFISDQTKSFLTPVFRPGLIIAKIRTPTTKKYFLKFISNSHISLHFFSIWKKR